MTKENVLFGLDVVVEYNIVGRGRLCYHPCHKTTPVLYEQIDVSTAVLDDAYYTEV